jgi:RNA polymerase sigma-70 factor (ECF subfamily)
MSETSPEEARRIAQGARDRVHFEEEALALAEQVYRVARGVSRNKEEAEDLMQETYARAFRSWESFTPGTNLRAWLLRILTNLNIDRGRRAQRTPDQQPLEEGDYFLYNRLESTSGESDEERILERLSQDHVAEALAAVPRLPRCARPRRHRRVQLRRGGTDSRHSDRHRHVAPSSWAAYPEAAACRTGGGGRMSEVDPCDWCEEVLQPYLDRDLNETDVKKVKTHLAGCSWCEKRFKFETDLRRLVRQAAVEPMEPELKAKLAALRLEL